MRIHEVLHAKGAAVVTVPPDLAVQEAMQILVRHNIGALVVFDGSLCGIITERDLLRAGSEDVHRLGTALVRDLMTEEVITVTPDADLRAVMDIMSEHRIRHLPVVNAGSLSGMISIGDVVNALRQSVEAENRYLNAYIHGTPL